MLSGKSKFSYITEFGFVTCVQPGVEVRTTTPGKWNKVVLRRHGASGAWQVTANHSDDMYMCVHIQRNALK